MNNKSNSFRCDTTPVNIFVPLLYQLFMSDAPHRAFYLEFYCTVGQKKGQYLKNVSAIQALQSDKLSFILNYCGSATTWLNQ